VVTLHLLVLVVESPMLWVKKGEIFMLKPLYVLRYSRTNGHSTSLMFNILSGRVDGNVSML
jgi:hypothetical protein